MRPDTMVVVPSVPVLSESVSSVHETPALSVHETWPVREVLLRKGKRVCWTFTCYHSYCKDNVLALLRISGKLSGIGIMSRHYDSCERSSVEKHRARMPSKRSPRPRYTFPFKNKTVVNQPSQFLHIFLSPSFPGSFPSGPKLATTYRNSSICSRSLDLKRMTRCLSKAARAMCLQSMDTKTISRWRQATRPTRTSPQSVVGRDVRRIGMPASNSLLSSARSAAALNLQYRLPKSTSMGVFAQASYNPNTCGLSTTVRFMTRCPITNFKRRPLVLRRAHAHILKRSPSIGRVTKLGL
jgi:hypothetical protein